MEGNPASQSKEGHATEEGYAAASSVSWRRGYTVRAVAALLGGLILRLWMLAAFPQTGGDSLIYGDLAKNLVRHGLFAITDGSGVIHSTLIRLPGYPLFVAACFRIFGMENYRAIIWLQIALELIACLLLADFVRRIATPRAGLNTLWLAAMCPFTAVYADAPLTESLTFDTICLGLWSLERYLNPSKCAVCGQSGKCGCPAFTPAVWVKVGPAKTLYLGLFTVAISSAALLRPDGALIAIALWPALLFARNRQIPFRKSLGNALLCGLVSVLPFAIWTARNWQVFHVFEPLAPRYANDPGEDPHLGWQHWVKTWCLDFACTNDIYWNAPDGQIALEDLPNQAFDSEAQKQQTAQLFAEYADDGQQISPELDARFEQLARDRTAAHPFRTRVGMPLGRLADMLLRPRVENLTIDLRWWEYWNHKPETRFSYAYALLNLLFLGLGVAGFCYRPQFWPYMLAYMVLRCLLLLTIEAPETRYTLEFFPFLFALGGVALQRIFSRRSRFKTQSVC